VGGRRKGKGEEGEEGERASRYIERRAEPSTAPYIQYIVQARTLHVCGENTLTHPRVGAQTKFAPADQAKARALQYCAIHAACSVCRHATWFHRL
jgi:hypothetical protein